jgi:hypothetical protein
LLWYAIRSACATAARTAAATPSRAAAETQQDLQAAVDKTGVEGGSHLEVFVDPPWEPQIAQAMVAFYDLHLKGDASAQARLASVGNQPGLLSLQTG